MSCRISARRALSSEAHLALFMYLLSNDFHSLSWNEYSPTTALPSPMQHAPNKNSLLNSCQTQRPIENVNTHTHAHTQCWGKVNAQLNLLIRSTKKIKKIKTNLHTLQFQSVWLVTLVQAPTTLTPSPQQIRRCCVVWQRPQATNPA